MAEKDITTDPLVRVERLLEEIDILGEYSFAEIEQHSYESWGYEVAWKVNPQEEEWFEDIIRKWEEGLIHYFDTYSRLSKDNEE